MEEEFYSSSFYTYLHSSFIKFIDLTFLKCYYLSIGKLRREIMIKEMKQLFIINLVALLLILLIGLIFFSSQLMFLSLGIFVSVISNLMLLYAVYKVVYRKSGKGSMFIDYSKRYILYIISLYFVYKLSNRFFVENTVSNIIFTALGFFAIQISLYLKQILKI